MTSVCKHLLLVTSRLLLLVRVVGVDSAPTEQLSVGTVFPVIRFQLNHENNKKNIANRFKIAAPSFDQSEKFFESIEPFVPSDVALLSSPTASVWLAPRATPHRRNPTSAQQTNIRYMNMNKYAVTAVSSSRQKHQ